MSKLAADFVVALGGITCNLKMGIVQEKKILAARHSK
jgi:hypothetical protein